MKIEPRERIQVELSAEVLRDLEAVTNPGNRSAFIERSIRAENCAGIRH